MPVDFVVSATAPAALVASTESESAAKVNDPNKERVLTAMYQFYYQHRHPYSHASADDFDTVIIEDRKVADELFNEVIQSMKAGFTELQ